MEGIVIRAFIDKHNGRGYHADDIYTAEDNRLLELAKLGYIEIQPAQENVSDTDTKKAVVSDSDTQTMLGEKKITAKKIKK